MCIVDGRLYHVIYMQVYRQRAPVGRLGGLAPTCPNNSMSRHMHVHTHTHTHTHNEDSLLQLTLSYLTGSDDLFFKKLRTLSLDKVVISRIIYGHVCT